MYLATLELRFLFLSFLQLQVLSRGDCWSNSTCHATCQTRKICHPQTAGVPRLQQATCGPKRGIPCTICHFGRHQSMKSSRIVRWSILWWLQYPPIFSTQDSSYPKFRSTTITTIQYYFRYDFHIVDLTSPHLSNGQTIVLKDISCQTNRRTTGWGPPVRSWFINHYNPH